MYSGGAGDPPSRTLQGIRFPAAVGAAAGYLSGFIEIFMVDSDHVFKAQLTFHSPIEANTCAKGYECTTTQPPLAPSWITARSKK